MINYLLSLKKLNCWLKLGTNKHFFSMFNSIGTMNQIVQNFHRYFAQVSFVIFFDITFNIVTTCLVAIA